jgi:DNA-binding response OmpR family regulator
MPKPIVVILDNDTSTLCFLEELLTDEGFSVICSSEHQISLSSIERLRPSLLIVELRPSATDTTMLLLDQLRRSPTTSAVPVIVNSTDGHLLSQLAETLRQLECAMLVKPFDLSALLTQIATCTDTSYDQQIEFGADIRG